MWTYLASTHVINMTAYWCLLCLSSYTVKKGNNILHLCLCRSFFGKTGKSPSTTKPTLPLDPPPPNSTKHAKCTEKEEEEEKEEQERDSIRNQAVVGSSGSPVFKRRTKRKRVILESDEEEEEEDEEKKVVKQHEERVVEVGSGNKDMEEEGEVGSEVGGKEDEEMRGQGAENGMAEGDKRIMYAYIFCTGAWILVSGDCIHMHCTILLLPYGIE